MKKAFSCLVRIKASEAWDVADPTTVCADVHACVCIDVYMCLNQWFPSGDPVKCKTYFHFTLAWRTQRRSAFEGSG